MTLAPLQFPFDGLPNEVSALFAVLKGGVYAIQCPGRQPGRNLLEIDLFSAHGGII
jgi:hypothetical protein